MVGLAAFAVLLGLGRGVRLAALAVARLLSRWLSPRAARAIGALVVVAGLVLLVSGVAVHVLLTAANGSFAAADAGTPAGAHRPTGPQRSGSPDSRIRWDSLGLFGREFVAGGPSSARIRAFTGTGMEPIRIYAGLATAADHETRARRAVADLVRAGGFRRSRLLVATTTGRGWLDPGTMSAFEYVAGGDSAIVTMQYSYVPSGISYLVDQSRARTAGRDLFDAVYERWSALPRGSPPRLYVFGESLGSYGAEARSAASSTCATARRGHSSWDPRTSIPSTGSSAPCGRPGRPRSNRSTAAAGPSASARTSPAAPRRPRRRGPGPGS